MTNITTLTFPSGRQLEKIVPISVSPRLSFYSAQERTIERKDEFSSSREIVRPAWVIISNSTDNETLKLWKYWSLNIRDYYAAACREVAIIDNHLAAVFSLDDAQLMNKFPNSRAESFLSTLCDMTIQLFNRGLVYKYWNWSNIVSEGDSWKLLPSLAMERTSEPTPSQALSRLAKWLLGLYVPFLQTQPARSILMLMESEQIPETLRADIPYDEPWKIQKLSDNPLQLDVTQNQTTIQLRWDWTLGDKAQLFCTDGKKQAKPGQFIWHESINQYGASLSNTPGIIPVINPNAGTAQWNRPQNSDKYQTYTITPAIQHEKWFEWGVPIIVGGPEEATLLNAYFDNESGDVVIAPYWPDDLVISRIYIVVRSDRYAQNVNDAQANFPLMIIDRRSINHPQRKKYNFSSQLYITAFNAVSIGNRIYFSPGQSNSCRKTIHKSAIKP